MSAPRPCIVCGREFFPAHKHYMTCSRKCGCKIRRGPSRTFRLSVACDTCGKIVRVNAFRRAHSKNLFCSQECRGRFKVTQYAGERNPNFRNAGWKICVGCGAKFKSYHSERKFCGVDCGHSYQKSHPMGAVTKGRNTELLAEHHAVAHMGYSSTLRMSGSRGPFDIVAIGVNGVAFIQVKHTVRTHAKAGIRPRDIEYLKKVAGGPRIYREFWVFVEGEGWRITRI
jgi:hypothetical protein